jgi:serine protease AprX
MDKVMKRYTKIAVAIAILYSSGASQEPGTKYWIYFRDKGDESHGAFEKMKSASDIYSMTGITARALARRAKVLPADHLISEEDMPVCQEYLEELARKNIVVANVSRWFNAVSAYLTQDQLNIVSSLSFVQGIEPVRIFVQRNPLPQLSAALPKTLSVSAGYLHNYGPSLQEMNMINVPAVHNLRITGSGVLVGMLDSGFRWRDVPAEQNMDVIKEYDFVQHDSVTANQAGDSPDQDSHGTQTLSLVGGYKEGELVAPAFEASFILAKTEYVPTETNIEEDNWVAGIEWEEENGADVVSSSLGYSIFDSVDANGNPQYSYTPADMNGHTATTTEAAAIAARLGVVVCNAMGNEGGDSWHIMVAPADADSIISVGAVTSADQHAYFSSYGPTSDGRTKPDVVALGVDNYVVSLSNPTGYEDDGQGTSYATPLTAGVAALILSAHPGLTPIQVRDALRNTANNAGAPNDTIGWGLIDAYKAILYDGMVLSTDPEITFTREGTNTVGVFAVSTVPVKKDSVRLFYSLGGSSSFSSVVMTLSTIVDSATNSGEYIATVPMQPLGTLIEYYVTAYDTSSSPKVAPYGAPGNFFEFTYGESNTTSVSSDSTQIPTSFELKQNYPNPFNPSTTIQYSLVKAGITTLVVYDVLGRTVKTIEHSYQAPGLKSVTFDGSTLSSGVYYYRLTSGNFSEVKKMILLK